MSFYQFFRSVPRLDELPFADLLPKTEIDRIAAEVGVDTAKEEKDGLIYTTALAMWAFLSQVLYKGEHRSCSAAVARAIALCIVLKLGASKGDADLFLNWSASPLFWPLCSGFKMGRVALGIAPQGSHRSGRAQLRHPARPAMDSHAAFLFVGVT